MNDHDERIKEFPIKTRRSVEENICIVVSYAVRAENHIIIPIGEFSFGIYQSIAGAVALRPGIETDKIKIVVAGRAGLRIYAGKHLGPPARFGAGFDIGRFGIGVGQARRQAAVYHACAERRFIKDNLLRRGPFRYKVELHPVKVLPGGGIYIEPDFFVQLARIRRVIAAI